MSSSRPGVRAEIAEQPATLRHLLETGWSEVRRTAAAIRSRDLPALVLAGRGSSGHAALYGRYVFEVRNGLPVVLAAPSVYTIYRRPPRLSRLAVIAVSQSGRTLETVEVLEEAHRQGALTVAVTNDPDSSLARSADLVLECRAGIELSVPATKTVTASMLVLAMLSEELNPDPVLRRALHRVPAAVEEVLDRAGEIEPLAGRLAGRRLVVLGRGYNLAAASEIALKLNEVAGLVAEAESGAEFMHGPIAMVGPDLDILVVEGEGPSAGHLRSAVAGFRDRGARVFRFSDALDLHEGAASLFALPGGLPEELIPIPAVVAGQLLATAVAAASGRDPDVVPGLQKVTQAL